MTLPLLRACHLCRSSVYVKSLSDRCPKCNAPLVPGVWSETTIDPDRGRVRIKVGMDFGRTAGDPEGSPAEPINIDVEEIWQIVVEGAVKKFRSSIAAGKTEEEAGEELEAYLDARYPGRPKRPRRSNRPPPEEGQGGAK